MTTLSNIGGLTISLVGVFGYFISNYQGFVYDYHNIKELYLIIAVMLFLLISCVYIYFNSFTVLLYNIMLEEQLRKESIKKEMWDCASLSTPPS